MHSIKSAIFVLNALIKFYQDWLTHRFGPDQVPFGMDRSFFSRIPLNTVESKLEKAKSLNDAENESNQDSCPIADLFEDADPLSLPNNVLKKLNQANSTSTDIIHEL